MYKFVVALSAVAGLFGAHAASAADLPFKAPPVAAGPAVRWTGCYVNAGLGYGMWNQEHFLETDPDHAPINTGTASGGRGWLGRIGGGCDYQFAPAFLVGALADYDAANLHGFAANAGLGGDEKESSAWAVGVRLGFLPSPNLMTFVSGGYTQARFDSVAISFTPVFPPVPTGLIQPAHAYGGWFIGSGFEYALPWFPAHGAFVRTEYRYAKYSADDLPLTFAGLPTGLAEHSEKAVQTVTTSLVWKFDVPGVNVAAAPTLLLKAPAAPAARWTGCYLDAGVGYGMWAQDRTGEFLPGGVPLTATETSGGRGWLGRFGAGCDYQVASRVVFGAFGDYDLMDLHNFVDLAGRGGQEKESSAWSLGGRLGYLPYPNVMTYASAGYTQTRFDQSTDFATAGVPPSPTGLFLAGHTYGGWFVGGGIDYAVPWLPVRGLFLRSEYRFSKYSADDVPLLVVGTGAPSGLGEHSEKAVQTVTTSLVWKFDVPGVR